MTTVTEFAFWKDVGFTDGCVEVPSYSQCSVISNPDWTIDSGYNVSVSRMFSEVKLKAVYENYREFSYLRMRVTYNNGNIPTKDYYGWIDSVELLSDTEEYPLVLVHWHIDLWRTYFTSATFGAGVVNRRSSTSGTYPPQNSPYLYRQVSGYDNILSYIDYPSEFAVLTPYIWCIIGYVRTTATETSTSESSWYIFPMKADGTRCSLAASPPPGGSAYVCPSVTEVCAGVMDEKLGLSPSRITGVWISMLPPIGGQLVDTNTIYLNSGTLYTHVYNTVTYSAWIMDGGSVRVPELFYADITMSTDEKTVTCITNERNEIVYTLPPRISVTSAQLWNSFSASGCYLIIRLISAVSGSDSKFSAAVGLDVRIPMPGVDVTSNSWSEYVYSGQRQYEIDSRLNEIEQTHLKGFASSIEGGMTGAMTGAMLGSGIGAIGGSVIGAVGSLISNEVTYNVDKGNADVLQRMEDTYQANQSANMLLYGNPLDWLTRNEVGVYIVTLSMDSYSEGRFDKQLSLNGVQVSEPTSSCTSLIHGTGPLQISQLVIGGPIPVEAKRYIKARLEQGVRLTTL